LHTWPEAHWVLEVQGGRQAPSTQSFPAAHCEALVHEFAGRGRHRPLEHVCVEEHSVSEVQPRTQVLLMQ
jgi:hypothetical protein